MSLSTAFNIAQKSIVSIEKQIAVISDNVTNANKTGYTRKIYQPTSIQGGDYSIPSTGSVVKAYVDDALTLQVNTQATSYQYSSTISSYLTNYSDNYGGTGNSATTISTELDNLTTALQSLESNPSQTANKSAIIANAQQLAGGLNQLSRAIQNQRQQANDAIGSTVTSINDNLAKIADLNHQISLATARGDATANLEDERAQALTDLSQLLDVQYSVTSDNQMNVSAAGIRLVLNSRTANLSYTPVDGVSSSTAYPGGFPGITVNGTDITTTINSGKLAALVALRDTNLPNEQDKLDAFASTLADTVNSVLANGTAYPAQNTLTGTTSVTSSTAISASGSWRVAVTDSSGNVQSYTDLALSSYTTIGALVTALNGISGVSASVSSGVLSITSTNSNYGISLNQMSSSIGGKGATQYFGFNNLFTSAGSITASGISVNSVLRSNSSALASATLSSGTLTIGGNGVSNADGTIATALVNAFNSSQSFVAAGNFSARTTTLSDYCSALISDAATQASSAKTAADTAQTTYSYLTNKLSSETGVNIDEESANLSSLQNYYNSSATVLSTIRSLFNTLLEAYK